MGELKVAHGSVPVLGSFENPPRGKLLDGKQAAKVNATRLGNLPDDCANWNSR